MYHLTWNDGSGYTRECVAPDEKTAWNLYWYILKYVEKSTCLPYDAWITIYSSGVAYDPTKGSKLPPTDNPLIILGKATEDD